jgi:PPOX class probable F420-dependent enzyme
LPPVGYHAAVPRPFDPHRVTPGFVAFWTERRIGTLVTLRRDGSPHVVPVGVTLDPAAGLARVICRRSSQKARNVDGSPRVAVSQFEGARWSTLEGLAVVRDEPDVVADAAPLRCPVSETAGESGARGHRDHSATCAGEHVVITLPAAAH